MLPARSSSRRGAIRTPDGLQLWFDERSRDSASRRWHGLCVLAEPTNGLSRRDPPGPAPTARVGRVRRPTRCSAVRKRAFKVMGRRIRARFSEAIARRLRHRCLPKDDAGFKSGKRRFQLTTVRSVARGGPPCTIDQNRRSSYQLRTDTSIPLRHLSPDSSWNLVDDALRYQSDPDHLEIWYFDFPGVSPSEWWKQYARLRTGAEPAIRWAEPDRLGTPLPRRVGAAGAAVLVLLPVQRLHQ
jgi:hypothetical protein